MDTYSQFQQHSRSTDNYRHKNISGDTESENTTTNTIRGLGPTLLSAPVIVSS